MENYFFEPGFKGKYHIFFSEEKFVVTHSMISEKYVFIFI